MRLNHLVITPKLLSNVCVWMCVCVFHSYFTHYNDVIMTTIASQITCLAVVYSTVFSVADQRKHQSSASLAFVWGIHRDRWIPRTKGQLRGKCFHFMTSSWVWFALIRQIYKPDGYVFCMQRATSRFVGVVSSCTVTVHSNRRYINWND